MPLASALVRVGRWVETDFDIDGCERSWRFDGSGCEWFWPRQISKCVPFLLNRSLND